MHINTKKCDNKHFGLFYSLFNPLIWPKLPYYLIVIWSIFVFFLHTFLDITFRDSNIFQFRKKIWPERKICYQIAKSWKWPILDLPTPPYSLNQSDSKFYNFRSHFHSYYAGFSVFPIFFLVTGEDCVKFRSITILLFPPLFP